MRFGFTRFNRAFAIVAVAGLALASSSALAQTPGKGQIVESKSPGITRYHDAAADPAKFPPSVALARPMDVKLTGPVTDSKVAPMFFTEGDGAAKKFGVKIAVEKGTSLYGTGEIAGPLLRNGRKTVCWNTDAYGYTDANESLYQSHPWVLAVRADGTAFGVFADTSWRCEIDLTTNDAIIFRGEGAAYPVYVIDRASPEEVVKGLAELIGTIPLPPRWAIGYHQCRYSYYPESVVRELAKEFRTRKLPCDVIWFDIDYMDGFRVFTFDKTHFPDVKKLNSDLGEMGFNRIWMIDPGVKAEKGYFVYDQMVEKDLMVKDAKGEPYRGEVWPGWCAYPDYTRPDVREWWQGLYKDFMAHGVSGVWNDMNEPAVFNVKSKTMPEDNKHAGGAYTPTESSAAAKSASATVRASGALDPDPMPTPGTLPPGPHLQYHNVYGTLMAKGTFDGIKAALPAKRPFVLTRAGSIGSQRYAATWTGDNSATWEDLENSISMTANLGLSGQPFAGPDIGGFNGNGPQGTDDADTKAQRAQLFGRWMGIGALLPFSRGHTGKGNIQKEPWSFGPETEQTCRFALERRSRLMPYLYTLFHESSVTGLPVLRPAFFADAKDPALRSEDDCFLLGKDLYVACKTTPLADRPSILPKGIWNPVYLVGEGDHKDLPRLYVRGGAIIPCGPVNQYSEQTPLNPLTLYVSLDENGTATGSVYEDEGDGYAYQRGDYLLTTYTAKMEKIKTAGRPDQNIGPAERTQFSIKISGTEGKRLRFQRAMRVVVLNGDSRWMGEATDGQSLMFDVERVKPVKWKE